MKEVKVENFTVLIEKGDGDYVISVRELPGVIGQVKDEKDAVPEIRRLIGAHLAEIARNRPKRKAGGPEGGNGGDTIKR